jgi:serine/threonine-protein kinase RsbT
MSRERTVAIRSDLDIVMARVEGRELAKELGFGVIDQARIATAISELTRNIVQYAGEGRAIMRPIEGRGRVGIEIICQDKGPGISDIQLAMQDGFSTSTSLGMGMPGAKRLMDEFEIESEVGMGTTVIIRRWRR